MHVLTVQSYYSIYTHITHMWIHAYSYRLTLTHWCGKVIALLTGNTKLNSNTGPYIPYLYMMWYSYTLYKYFILFYFYDYSKWIIIANNQHKNTHNTIAWKEECNSECVLCGVCKAKCKQRYEWMSEYVRGLGGIFCTSHMLKSVQLFRER